MMTAASIEPYAPRAISTLSPLRIRDWTLKRYAIRYGEAPFDDRRFESGRAFALAALPSPAVIPGRCGVGFMIEHQGNRIDYIVLAWWDRQNELPLRVYVREAGAEWRAARGSESVCVWDMQVLWAERQAYVATAMSGMPANSYVERDALAFIEDAPRRRS